MLENQTSCDTIRLAIQRELDAYHFFIALSKSVKKSGIKCLLKDLAKEELGHKDRLELELMKQGDVVTADERPQRENPYRVEAEEWADMDYGDLLKLCTEKENISFRLYVDMAANLQDDDIRKTLLALAEEELRHKLRFRMELEKLPKRN